MRLFLLGILLSGAITSGIPAKPSVERLVNDFAGCFPVYAADSLERALVEFDDSTSNQICVVTVPTLDGMDVAKYALRLGQNWGVGTQKHNGLVLLLKPKGDEEFTEVTIQVGYGLEGAIPDVYAYRIIQNIMGPRLKNQEYFKAVSLACEELMLLAKGEISEPRTKDDELPEEVWYILAFLIIGSTLLFLVISSKGQKRKGGDDDNSFGGGGGPIIFFGPGHRGGGHSGGGFGGFGSGGFGGFGGGSFGGGGASGRF